MQLLLYGLSLSYFSPILQENQVSAETLPWALSQCSQLSKAVASGRNCPSILITVPWVGTEDTELQSC